MPQNKRCERCNNEGRNRPAITTDELTGGGLCIDHAEREADSLSAMVETMRIDIAAAKARRTAAQFAPLHVVHGAAGLEVRV